MFARVVAHARLGAQEEKKAAPVVAAGPDKSVPDKDAAIDKETDACTWDPAQTFSKNLYKTHNSGSTVTKAESDSFIYVVRYANSS